MFLDGTSRQLVRCSDMPGVGSKPDSSATVATRRSGLEPTFMSGPFRASEWVSSVRFHPRESDPFGLNHNSDLTFCLRMIFSDLTSPAEAGFAKAGNRFPLIGIMR